MSESDKDHWRDLIAVFENSPIAAFEFARAVMRARNSLDTKQVQAIEDLIDALFPYTNFFDACRRLYWLSIRGQLKPEHDPVLLVAAADPKFPPRRIKPRSLNDQVTRGMPPHERGKP